MIRPVITLKRRRILVDINTQRDFLTEQGNCCVRNHRRVLANIRRIMAWSRLKNIKVISTSMVIDRANGRKCCIAGTPGQQKISYTLRNQRMAFPADGSTDRPRDVLKQYDQIILHTRCGNPFEEPRADRVLSEIKADEFIIIGTLTEEAVKHTALGLLARRKNVTFINDATGYIDKNTSEIAARQIEAKGAKVTDIRNLLGSGRINLVNACGCQRCMGKYQKDAVGLAN
jgi:nicotinamidase-related amidase